jgi:hypothetical protein
MKWVLGERTLAPPRGACRGGTFATGGIGLRPRPPANLWHPFGMGWTRQVVSACGLNHRLISDIPIGMGWTRQAVTDLRPGPRADGRVTNGVDSRFQRISHGCLPDDQTGKTLGLENPRECVPSLAKNLALSSELVEGYFHRKSTDSGGRGDPLAPSPSESVDFLRM